MKTTTTTTQRANKKKIQEIARTMQKHKLIICSCREWDLQYIVELFFKHTKGNIYLEQFAIEFGFFLKIYKYFFFNFTILILLPYQNIIWVYGYLVVNSIQCEGGKGLLWFCNRFVVVCKVLLSVLFIWSFSFHGIDKRKLMNRMKKTTRKPIFIRKMR